MSIGYNLKLPNHKQFISVTSPVVLDWKSTGSRPPRQLLPISIEGREISLTFPLIETYNVVYFY